MNISIETPQGSFVTKDKKKFLVLKCNKTFFYAIEITPTLNAKDFLEKFSTKPKNHKMEDFIKLTGMLKLKYSDNYEVLTEKIIADKDIKKKNIGASPCCGNKALEIFYRKGYTGRSWCKKCGKTFNILKLEKEEDKTWLIYSQEMTWFKINVDTKDIEVKGYMGMFNIRENNLTKTTETIIIEEEKENV